MKRFLIITCFFLTSSSCFSQQAENIIIITTDGFRWQEVFRGMDSAIANNTKFNQWDSIGIYKKYWADNTIARRKKLLPFLWTTIAERGSIYGNRDKLNKVDNANPYWFSYPGYNEIFTGYPDTAVNSNDYPPNPHTNLLEYLNTLPAYKGKVAAFGAWDAFDRILNEKRSGIPVYSAFDHVTDIENTARGKAINQMRTDSYRPFGDEECLDVFTHYAAMEYLQTKHPRILYISYGETDEWAHSGKYKDYLNAAHMVDKWISDIWNYVQQDPFYKNKTALFFTVDHGRGDNNKEEWVTHGGDIKDAHEIWFATMGPGIEYGGEKSTVAQYYQKQFAQTIAGILGLTFKAEHPIGEKINISQ